MNSTILEVHELRKTYGAFTALSGVNFSVRSGEIISVLGPSGCGKSTLLQLIAGLQQPDSGEIRLRGAVVSSAARLVPPEKRSINMVFQDYALWPHMTVYDNIAYGLHRRKAPAAERERKMKELVSLLHLEGLEQRLPPQLSGGQQQRVAIARALATQPDLLLLDEPLSNLDMRLRIEMRTEMGYLFRRLGTTVFHVTHDPDEAFALADRMVVMRAGRIDQLDVPQACYSMPATRSVASLLGAGNRLQGQWVGTSAQPAVRIQDEVIECLMPAGTVPSTEQVDLLFRPEDVHWIDSAHEEVAAAASLSGQTVNGKHGERSVPANLLPVRIVHCAFEGSKWRLLASTPDGQKLAFMHPISLEPGTSGCVAISSKSAYVYPHEDER
ncbi:ABC transporter ATP-binding protein [Paenibacillus sp. H1-7]|uniref:ABC transporter ATP-binding protein n=1 Tax=Paenibacillus sp. H1-7 TaxID=2282849 RepID=UPI001EF843EA|nr:ABC transporter ATP-binding protein [Paenibacillus sp. H1-7]ULL13968.1 ABC transporter ATP-binding protein [Paenibacillus sp. H1-7]